MKKLTTTQIAKALAYVRGKMNAKERLDFEKSMSNNVALREEVEFQSSIASALNLDQVEENMEHARIQHLLDHKESHPQYKAIQKNLNLARKTNAARNSQFRKIVVFSIAILFIGVISIVGMSSGQEEKLNLSFHEIVNSLDFEKDLLTNAEVAEVAEVDGRIAAVKIGLSAAKVNYDQQEWRKTLSELQQIEKQFGLNPDSFKFYYSVLFFQQKKFQKIIDILEPLNLKGGANYCKVQHLLILSYFKLDKKLKAEIVFNELNMHPELCDQKVMKSLRKLF